MPGNLIFYTNSAGKRFSKTVKYSTTQSIFTQGERLGCQDIIFLSTCRVRAH